MLFAALLLASAAVPDGTFPSEPDFELELNETKIPISCKENPAELTRLQVLSKETDHKARPLRSKRKNGTMTLPESALLYGYDLTIVSLSLGIATRKHAGFLCQYPKIWPKRESEPPPEPSGAST